jgi:hypothetical protein
MPESLTRKKTSPGVRLQIGTASGFNSEPRPASDRNGVRLRVGIPVRNKSESAPWNTMYLQRGPFAAA